MLKPCGAHLWEYDQSQGFGSQWMLKPSPLFHWKFD
uniref:Uncharacterized protein n=1 Tax=Brassica campestris TaxID=3711 RepID=A0A3P6BS16_BRACM|nr:unnamed protein product [Brassica rapa]